MINVLLVGDVSGNPDEGMKTICRHLNESLNRLAGMRSQFVSLKEVLGKPALHRPCDIVHYMSGPSWRSFAYCKLMRLRLGKSPRVIMSFIHPHWGLLAEMMLRALPPDGAVALSEKWQARCAAAGLELSDTPLAGVDLERFGTVSPEKKRDLRQTLGFPEDRVVVLHVGHLNTGRNLAAFHCFKGQGEFFPVVVGSTTVSPNTEVVNGLRDAGVTVIHKYIQRIEEYYQAADCYLFPTIDDRWCVQVPLSVIESLACGTPVVATRFEGLPILLPEGTDGLTYIDSFDNLRETVRQVARGGPVSQPESLRRLDWGRIARKLNEYYDHMLNSK